MKIPAQLLCPLPEGASLTYSPTPGVTLTINPSRLIVSFTTSSKVFSFVVKEGEAYGVSDFTKVLAKDTFELFLCRLELIQYLYENPSATRQYV